jgi:hypothetical protein
MATYLCIVNITVMLVSSKLPLKNSRRFLATLSRESRERRDTNRAVRRSLT